MGKAIGSAHAPAFNLSEVSPETAAAGYEANGADTDFIALFLSPGYQSPMVGVLRSYRATAENVFEGTLQRPA